MAQTTAMEIGAPHPFLRAVRPGRPKMSRIVTLTMNPAIDIAYEADCLVPDRKLRVGKERYDPGGGGINVARVIKALGGDATVYCLAGGKTANLFSSLLEESGLETRLLPIRGDVRTSTAIFDRSTNQQFRFIPPGPDVSQGEWKHCLAQLEKLRCDYLVASGSLPPGVPADFYARLAPLAKKQGFRLVLDSSGAALTHALNEGKLYLVKASRGELSEMVGRSLESLDDVASAAEQIVGKGVTDLLAVTLGSEGAILAQSGGVIALPGVPLRAASTVGAGDSFLGAMVWALANDHSVADAFRLGIAAGTAAVLNPGTALCDRTDIEGILATLGPAKSFRQDKTSVAVRESDP